MLRAQIRYVSEWSKRKKNFLRENYGTTLNITCCVSIVAIFAGNFRQEDVPVMR
jgi:hypothetical protein